MDLKEPLLAEKNTSNPKVSRKIKVLICAIMVLILLAVALIVAIIFLNQEELQITFVQEYQKHKIKLLTLQNGLQALLIFDTSYESKDSFVSLSVPVGYIHEGEVQGLARLFEHMSFYQNRTQTQDSYLLNFIQSKGGYFNAITTLQETNFYFRVNSESLYQSLDILASFLKKPSIQEKDIENEVQIIDEE